MTQQQADRLCVLLMAKQDRDQLSDREVGRRAGISRMTVASIKEGRKVNRGTLAKVCQWLGVGVEAINK